MKARSTAKLEGEGSYSATRRYNAGLAKHVKGANVAGLAREAARAVDGPEGKSLKRAEVAGKRGPHAKTQAKR